MIYLLDLLGTFAFAIGGAFKARGRQLNIFGIIFLGAITAVGGGTIRDLIIGRVPLFYLRDKNYLLICILAGLLAYCLPKFFKKTYSAFRLIDSIGLAAFVIIGASVSQDYLFANLAYPTVISALACVFLGMLTGFGGGVLRDTVMGDTPFSLKRGSNYVASAFWGATVFYELRFINPELALAASMAITLILREIVSPYGIYKKVIIRNK